MEADGTIMVMVQQIIRRFQWRI